MAFDSEDINNFSEDEEESDIEEILESSGTGLMEDDETVPPSVRSSFPPPAEPRVSPSQSKKPKKHVPQVYQPVYPASSVTIAGGVSPNVSPSPGKGNGKRENVFRGDEKVDDGVVPDENTAESSGFVSMQASETVSLSTTEKVTHCTTHTTASGLDTETKRETKPMTPTGKITTSRKTWQVSSPSTQKRMASTLSLKPKTIARSTNPVETHKAKLAARRREAAQSAPRTPHQAKALTKGTKKAEPFTKNLARDHKGDVVSTLYTHPPRVVRADLVSGLPIFSKRVAEVMLDTGVTDFLVENKDGTTSEPSRYASEKKTLKKSNPSCFVATAETGPGGTYLACRGSGSPYAPIPTHRTYGWYKQFGFAGKGASSSWGHNPKRIDIQKKYDDAKVVRGGKRSAGCTAYLF